MQYRRLIDLEFEAIAASEGSGEIQQIPTIADFYDIAVGHHKKLMTAKRLSDWFW